MRRTLGIVLLLSWIVALGGCGGGNGERRALLQNKGSDTLVNVAQAWAETYRR